MCSFQIEFLGRMLVLKNDIDMGVITNMFGKC